VSIRVRVGIRVRSRVMWLGLGFWSGFGLDLGLRLGSALQVGVGVVVRFRDRVGGVLLKKRIMILGQSNAIIRRTVLLQNALADPPLLFKSRADTAGEYVPQPGMSSPAK
jgi:hypothetical protein